MRQPRELQEAVRLGEAAQGLLDNDALQTAFQRVEQRVIAQWRSADTVQERERAFALVRALDELQHELQTMVADGRYAAEVVRRSVASDAITGRPERR